MFGEYIPSNSGTVDTLTLSDGRQIQVSAVDGETPYIVSGNNAYNYNFAQTVRSNPAFSDRKQVFVQTLGTTNQSSKNYESTKNCQSR